MLKNIHIQNFRCFEDFKAEGFERINLIGGKNNSGKTCLLEGIQCLNVNLHSIAKQRNEEIESLLNNRDKHEINLTADIEFPYLWKSKLIFNNNNKEYKRHDDNLGNLILFIKGKFTNPNLVDLVNATEPNDIFFIESEIKKIDKNILEIASYGLIENLPFSIKDIKNRYFANTSLGDAITFFYNIYSFFANRISNKIVNAILLIDEIENGIHYTAHHDFWRNIFKLSKELNVQVFATTHSLEMIRAFNEVALEFEKENPEEKGAYYEMVRNDDTGNISALKHTMAQLEDELESGMEFRGEKYKDKIAINQKLIETLQGAVNTAQEGLRKNNIPVPFIKDGWIWQTNVDGSIEKVEELETIK